MANLIKIKRSSSTASPSQLSNGELAWTEGGNVLFIGSYDGLSNIPIGGKRFPGTLTANQAIVTDASNFIDKLMVGNTTVNVVANSTSIKLANSTVNTQITVPTAAQYSGQYFLHANGSWVLVATSSPGGSNTYVQFNDSTALNGTAGFTFDKTTNNMLLANTQTYGNSTVNSTANAIMISIANSTATANLSLASGLVIGTSTVNSTVVAAGANVILSTSDLKVGNSTVNSTQSSVLVQVANSTSTANLNPLSLVIGSSITNSTGYYLGTSVVNSTVVAAGANVILSTSDLKVGNSTVNSTQSSVLVQVANSTSTANLNPVALTIGTTVANSTAFAIGTAFTANSTLVNAAALNVVGQVNTATFFATTSANVGANVQLTTTAALIGNSTANLTANSILVKVANSTSTANLTPLGLVVGTTVVNSSVVQVAGGPTINSTTISTTDITVSGNLTVSGTLTTIDATNLNVKDSMIFLADQNANQASFTDTVDIGFIGQYGNTTQAQYTGFFRDASSTGKLWKLIDATSNAPAPGTTVDTTNTAFSYAILQSYLKVTGNVQGDGSGVFTANASGVNAVANSTWYVNLTANTITLSTALAAGSGGTGQSTYADGDILYGASSALSKLTRGSDGQVLQANSTQITWGSLDGGTFLKDTLLLNSHINERYEPALVKGGPRNRWERLDLCISGGIENIRDTI